MKTAIVTGCSRPEGFGQRIARTLALAGFEVFATLRRVERGEGLTQWAEQQGVGITTVEHDVTSSTDNRQVVQQVLDERGRIDVLVNNVGMSSFGALETLFDGHIREVMETNFFSAVELTRSVLPAMRQQGGGRIVFMSSMAGAIGIPGESVYCASKFALEGLAESLAMETARFGIDVSTIRPAFFNTGMSQENTDASRFFDRNTPYDAFNDRVVRSTSEGEVNGEDPQLVADMVLKAVEATPAILRWYPGESAPAIRDARATMDDSSWREYVMNELDMSDWLSPVQAKETGVIL